MARDMSKIEWTHYTFNPWWGCTKVSAGCKNCYAEAMDSRLKGGHWGYRAPRRYFGTEYWKKPLKWDQKAARDGVRRRVFCASMADVFEEHPVANERWKQHEARELLWKLIDRTPNLDWLLLTKRPEKADNFVPDHWHGESPPSNVWLGVTAENQESATKRIPWLFGTKWASVTFVSYEPAIGPLDLDPPRCDGGCNWYEGGLWSLGSDGATPFCDECGQEMAHGAWLDPLNGGVDWVIAGAESGKGARPMDLEWIRQVQRQCRDHGVPFFFKQAMDGGRKVSMPRLDGVRYAELPGHYDDDDEPDVGVLL